MKEGWTNCKIGDICSITDFVSNGSFASLKENVKYYNSPNYAVLIRLADASNGFDKSKFVYTDKQGYDFSKKSHLYGGELIMSNVGSVGSMFICPAMIQPMTLAPNTISITSQNNKFLYYYFLSEGFKSKLKGITSSTTLKKFNKTNFKLLEIEIPSLSEQQSIVDYLDSAFAKIDAMKANAEKALNEAKALFQSSLKEMLEPKEGWEEKTIEYYAKIVHGKNQKDVLDNNGLYPIYGSGGNIMGYANSYLCDAGTTILGRKGTIDNPIYIEEKFWNVDTAFGIIAKDNCNKKFLYYSIKNVDWAKRNTGTTLPSLTQNVVYNVEMCAPSLSEQQSIVDYLDTLKSKIDCLQENYTKISQECDALKQAILRQVFE